MMLDDRRQVVWLARDYPDDLNRRLLRLWSQNNGIEPKRVRRDHGVAVVEQGGRRFILAALYRVANDGRRFVDPADPMRPLSQLHLAPERSPMTGVRLVQAGAVVPESLSLPARWPQAIDHC